VVIVPNRIGQLGNQLFHIAHFAASSMQNHFKTIFACFEFPLDFFPKINSHKNIRVLCISDLRNKWQYRFVKLLRLTAQNSPFHECIVSLDPPHLPTGSEDFVRKAKRKILFCEGFAFRDPDNIAKHFDQVVSLFEFKQQVKDDVLAFSSSNRINNGIFLVGFHIRRADYREFNGGKFYIEDAQWSLLIQMVRHQINASGRRFMGIIFSNENVDFLTKSRDDLMLGPGGMLTDLAMLARCNLIIAPPSTYSGWASFSGRVPLLHIDKRTDSVDISVAKPLEW